MSFYSLYIFYGINQLKLPPPKRLFSLCLLFRILIIIKTDLTIKKYNLYYYSDLFIFLKLVFIHLKNCLQARYGR